MAYEYKVVPAPTKGLKARGVKTSADRFAHALQTTMNALGVDGWEYQRTDTLPCEEREGLMGKTTVFQNMLVFRRALTIAEETPVQDPVAALPAPEPDPVPDVEAASDEQVTETAPQDTDASDDTSRIAAA